MRPHWHWQARGHSCARSLTPTASEPGPAALRSGESCRGYAGPGHVTVVHTAVAVAVKLAGLPRASFRRHLSDRVDGQLPLGRRWRHTKEPHLPVPQADTRRAAGPTSRVESAAQPRSDRVVPCHSTSAALRTRGIASKPRRRRRCSESSSEFAGIPPNDTLARGRAHLTAACSS
jgi:hypothetical protein